VPSLSLRTFAVGAVMVALVACTSTTQQGATGINRQQLLLISSAEVDALSLESYQGELKKARDKKRLNTDRANLERIRVIADRLIPHVTVFRQDALSWGWEVNLETRDELNAYCAPGGKIMFFTGIITKLKLTDDEIAAIMGHEIAHALREHGRERMSRAYAQQAGLGIITAGLGLGGGSAQMLQMAADVGLSLPHSRGQETESDIIGLELMARAGFNPNAAVTLWQKMAGASGGGSSFLSTHPSSGQRINELNARIPTVMPLYQQAQRNKPALRRIVPRTI